jgi:hypothetical protein
MPVFGGLWYEHSMRFVPALDEMVRPNICHEFGAGNKLNMELLLNLVEHLYVMSVKGNSSSKKLSLYLCIIVHFHDGRVVSFRILGIRLATARVLAKDLGRFKSTCWFWKICDTLYVFFMYSNNLGEIRRPRVPLTRSVLALSAIRSLAI